MTTAVISGFTEASTTITTGNTKVIVIPNNYLHRSITVLLQYYFCRGVGHVWYQSSQCHGVIQFGARPLQYHQQYHFDIVTWTNSVARISFWNLQFYTAAPYWLSTQQVLLTRPGYYMARERYAWITVTCRCSAVQQVTEDWLLSGSFQVRCDSSTAKEEWTRS